MGILMIWNQLSCGLPLKFKRSNSLLSKKGRL